MDSRHLARIDLRALQPTPDGLLEALGRIAALGFDGFSILYEDTFPWTVDDRMRCDRCYPEHVIAGIGEWCRKRGLVHGIEISAYGLTDTVLAIPSFAHLRDFEPMVPDSSRFEPTARNMIEHIVDDVCALIPNAALIFSPSSLFARSDLTPNLYECLAKVREEKAGGSFSVAEAPSDGWSRLSRIAPSEDALGEVYVAWLSTCACYGSPAERAIVSMIGDLAGLLSARTGRRIENAPDDTARAFQRFEQVRAEVTGALESAERSIAAATAASAGRREGASIHARRALQAVADAVIRLDDAGRSLEHISRRRIAGSGLKQYLAETTAPLIERHAAARGRLDALAQRLVAPRRPAQ